MSELLKKATEFFKSEQTYDKLFNAFRKKYESLGRIGGTVSTNSFSDKELETIGKFFGQPSGILRQKQLISLAAFEEQLQRTKFSSVALKELLDNYFGETIISKKEQLLQKEENRRNFFHQLMEQYPSIKFWLEFCLENSKSSRWVIQLADNDKGQFTTYVKILHDALNDFPDSVERLPLFSQRITADPHAFDLNTDLGRLLIHLLSVHQGDEEVPTMTEEINFLLQQYGIYRDDLLNFVTCANLLAETNKGDHPVWTSAAQTNTVQIVPLRELLKVTTVWPSTGNTVWIVENSGVCATLLDANPAVPIICTNGQFTLATWMLIDKLVNGGAQIFYAGDFDPEGLGIADRLLERCGNSATLWHMDITSYRKTGPTKSLTVERLEKLNRLNHPQLVAVAVEMRATKKAGYQEALMDEMVTDIIQHRGDFI